MSSLTDIKYRMKAVSDTRQITGAMETISVAKMRKALARYDANKFYFESILQTISDIVYHTSSVNESYFTKKSGDKSLYIVIASDKGLAGGFNHNILNFAWQRIESAQKQSTVYAVGQLTREFFEKKQLAVDSDFCGIAYEPDLEDSKEIATAVLKRFHEEGCEVHICYTKMSAGSVMQPEIIQLLPLTADLVKRREMSVNDELMLQEIEYEPSPEEVLDSLIMQYLTGVVYGALVQSVACEHSSRRTAMNNASKNANKILHDLGARYNRARQESVTNELTEIITSAMGVTK